MRFSLTAVAAAAVVATLVASADASADDGDGDGTKEATPEQPTEKPPAADPKKKLQDYGGPPRETDVGDVVVWPPRVVLFPLWLIDEYVFRDPLGVLVRAAEKGNWVAEVTDFFTFGPRKQFSIYPSALIDFGLLPSVGFNATWKYLGDDHNTARLHFGTWGPNWIAAKGIDTYDLAKNEHVSFEASYVRRRDDPFSGIGPRSREDDRARYNATTSEVALQHTWDFWRSSTITTRAGSRTLLFGEGTCCSDDSVYDALQQNRFTAPGYGRGYAAGFQRVALEIDTRRPRPSPGSGLRIEGHEETAYTLDSDPGTERRSWVKYGGTVGGAVDLTGTQRVIAAALSVELADPIVGSIPFTDLVTLGGDDYMPGYLRGRLVDRSAVIATLQYRWPVWAYLDGFMVGSLGNVWGKEFEGFDVKASRISTGLGVASNGDRDSGFEILFAVGTEPLDEKFQVNSFRLVFGSHHGF